MIEWGRVLALRAFTRPHSIIRRYDKKPCFVNGSEVEGFGQFSGYLIGHFH